MKDDGFLEELGQIGRRRFLGLFGLVVLAFAGVAGCGSVPGGEGGGEEEGDEQQGGDEGGGEGEQEGGDDEEEEGY